MTLPRLARILVYLAVFLAALQVIGFVLFDRGGTQPPLRGHGDPVGYSRQP
jgi:hypothetical protein